VVIKIKLIMDILRSHLTQFQFSPLRNGLLLSPVYCQFYGIESQV